jgi:hypothetical protein
MKVVLTGVTDVAGFVQYWLKVDGKWTSNPLYCRGSNCW